MNSSLFDGILFNCLKDRKLIIRGLELIHPATLTEKRAMKKEEEEELIHVGTYGPSNCNLIFLS